MTPEQRSAFIEAALVIWDLLARYGNEQAGEIAKALRAEGPGLDDDLVIGMVDRVLRVTAGELVTMGVSLRASVKMGSDYGAAFTAVQAEPASEALRKKGDRQRQRARQLKAEGLSNPKIAAELGVTVRRVQMLVQKPKD